MRITGIPYEEYKTNLIAATTRHLPGATQALATEAPQLAARSRHLTNATAQ